MISEADAAGSYATSGYQFNSPASQTINAPADAAYFAAVEIMNAGPATNITISAIQ